MPRIVLTVDGETVYDSANLELHATMEKHVTPIKGVQQETITKTLEPISGGAKGKKAKKEKKAKGTRKLSPYMKFAQEARPKILKENPEMKSDIIGVGRKIGEMWRALSDTEKARY
jgi:hypothetical protein